MFCENETRFLTENGRRAPPTGTTQGHAITSSSSAVHSDPLKRARALAAPLADERPEAGFQSPETRMKRFHRWARRASWTSAPGNVQEKPAFSSQALGRPQKWKRVAQ